MNYEVVAKVDRRKRTPMTSPKNSHLEKRKRLVNDLGQGPVRRTVLAEGKRTRLDTRDSLCDPYTEAAALGQVRMCTKRSENRLNKQRLG